MLGQNVSDLAAAGSVVLEMRRAHVLVSITLVFNMVR